MIMTHYGGAPSPRRPVGIQQDLWIEFETACGIGRYIVRRKGAPDVSLGAQQQPANLLIGISIRVIEDLIKHGP